VDQSIGIVYVPSFVVVDFESEAQGNQISDWQKKRTDKHEIPEAGEKVGLDGMGRCPDKVPTRDAPQPLATARDSDLFQYRQLPSESSGRGEVWPSRLITVTPAKAPEHAHISPGR
jgi:hypothetical protein